MTVPSIPRSEASDAIIANSYCETIWSKSAYATNVVSLIEDVLLEGTQHLGMFSSSGD